MPRSTPHDLPSALLLLPVRRLMAQLARLPVRVGVWEAGERTARALAHKPAILEQTVFGELAQSLPPNVGPARLEEAEPRARTPRAPVPAGRAPAPRASEPLTAARTRARDVMPPTANDRSPSRVPAASGATPQRGQSRREVWTPASRESQVRSAAPLPAAGAPPVAKRGRSTPDLRAAPASFAEASTSRTVAAAPDVALGIDQTVRETRARESGIGVAASGPRSVGAASAPSASPALVQIGALADALLRPIAVRPRGASAAAPASTTSPEAVSAPLAALPKPRVASAGLPLEASRRRGAHELASIARGQPAATTSALAAPDRAESPAWARDSESLAELVNDVLVEQARRNGVDLS